MSEGRQTELLEQELALARDHPRGTEQRMLAPFRAALNDAAAYGALSVTDRDAIVRWAAIRCAVRDRFGVDRDQLNLAEPPGKFTVLLKTFGLPKSLPRRPSTFSVLQVLRPP